MLSYSWPGNIRELENSVERACVIGRDKWIQKGDLFLNHSSAAEQKNGDRSLKYAVNAFKASFIRKILEENSWNQTETARILDIQRTYLSRLIKELDIINPKE
jgi:Nif-specific regulatory protein